MDSVLTKIHKRVGPLTSLLTFFVIGFHLGALTGNSVNCGGHRAPSCGVCYGAVVHPNHNTVNVSSKIGTGVKLLIIYKIEPEPENL